MNIKSIAVLVGLTVLLVFGSRAECQQTVERLDFEQPRVASRKTYKATLIPSQYSPKRVFRQSPASKVKVRLATFQDGVENNKFQQRQVQQLEPKKIPIIESIQRTAKDLNQRTEPKVGSRGEFIYDGSDRGQRIVVDDQWKIHGLDTEDTIGHFDTVDGRRLVSPSNRVEIYAPRFSAIRQISDFSRTRFQQGPRSANSKLPLQLADGSDFSSTTKQNLQLNRFKASRRASSFRDSTRGLTSETSVVLQGTRNRIEPYSDMGIIRFGRYSSTEGARLNLGMMSANVWRDDLGLQVSAANATPVIVNDVYKVQQIETIETDGDNAILRVLKIASRLNGRPGDEIEFTIRFDNLSAKPIGNVTIVDNLTRRLEFVEGSAESTLKANFITKENSEGSLILRWEISDPLPNGKGGVVRFKCRVR